MIKLWAARFAAASTIATFLCSSLASQTTILSDEKTALRVEQQAVFEQMFDKPDDLDLMFRYAIVSIQLEDLEAAYRPTRNTSPDISDASRPKSSPPGTAMNDPDILTLETKLTPKHKRRASL